MGKLYALLVGIDAYPPGVKPLRGCVNDVGRYKRFLERHYADTVDIKALTDAAASRAAVIDGFRSHLALAGPADAVLFQFSGHGAQSTAAPEFREFAPDGYEEGLLCHDSRQPGQFDLADKELAVLIAEVAEKCPHITVILDSCHSGSGTRSADEIEGAVARFSDPAPYKRELGQYLDGYYVRQLQAGAISIPASRHILLAGCQNDQTSKEIAGAGIFTSTLLDVLEKTGPAITYVDLFVQARAAVRQRAAAQEPQFETIGDFNARSGFLGSSVANTGRRFRAVKTPSGWQVNCGAIHGAPTDPTRAVAFALYAPGAPDDAPPLGNASTTVVGANTSELAVGFAVPPGMEAMAAEMTSLPVPPLLVAFAGPDAHRAALAAALAADRSAGAALVAAGGRGDYTIAVADTPYGKALMVSHGDTGHAIEGVMFDPDHPAAGCDDLVRIIRHIAAWQRGLALQNAATRMDKSLIDVAYIEQRSDGTSITHPPGEAVLEYRKVDGVWQDIRGKLKLRNRTGQQLHVALVYFSPEFQIFPVANVQVPVADLAAPEAGWMTLMGDRPNQVFRLDDGVMHLDNSFKLIISTERIDDFLLAQKKLQIGRVAGSDRSGFVEAEPPEKQIAKIPFKNEWFTVTMRFKLVRRLDVVGTSDANLAGGAITIKAHPAITADAALTAAATNTRSASDPDFFRAFAGGGMAMIDFAAGTRGAEANVLELTGIKGAETLAAHPLEIVLNTPLAANETITVLTHDGEFVRLGGDVCKQDDGSTLIRVDRIPPPAEDSRSLLGAVKLYFFKTVLKQANVDLLRWVEYDAKGKAIRHANNVADKVAAAKNILLLVHGIIGDTEDMAQGIRACGVIDAGQFDLVLTYDYESLGTPIEETAAALAMKLLGVGIGKDDGKRVTIVAHSMGGLVSRWCIERWQNEHCRGADLIDHLVMCGTPNNGSPFGTVDGAIAIAEFFGDVSVNMLPAAVPFVAPLRAVLKTTRSLTRALAQMNPQSPFLLDLNASGDPGVRYTILAGNIDDYAATQDAFFGRLIVSVGRSSAFDLVFGRQPNDIAVGSESIRGVNGVRALPPTRTNVACHHLNYFSSPAGQAALLDVIWQ